MENDLLRDVIEVEKEIQRSLEQAKDASHQWLEAQKREIAEETGRQEKQITESFNQAQELARKNAENKASDVVTKAEQLADRIAHIENDTLSKIVANHIHKILPG